MDKEFFINDKELHIILRTQDFRPITQILDEQISAVSATLICASDIVSVIMEYMPGWFCNEQQTKHVEDANFNRMHSYQIEHHLIQEMVDDYVELKDETYLINNSKNHYCELDMMMKIFDITPSIYIESCTIKKCGCCTIKKIIPQSAEPPGLIQRFLKYRLP